MDLQFESDPSTVDAEALSGFFVGWPSPPTPAEHLNILRSSYRSIVARDGSRVIGFITAISDGHLAAYLPLLEVLPEYQGSGIGTELVRRMLDDLGHLYMVDLCCDADIAGFYERVGLQRVVGMVRRNANALRTSE